MSGRADGGPAFPTNYKHRVNEPGMTLRDYFAAKAMASTIQSEAFMTSISTLSDAAGVGKIRMLAKFSYDLADAMLAAREKGGAA